MSKETWVCLITIRSEEGSISHVFEKPAFSIGRTREVDLPIVDPSVSRQHLIVQLTGDQIQIRDNKSANGTFVNEVRINPDQSTTINPSDVVRIGHNKSRFQFFAIPKPFEMLNQQNQEGALILSLDEVSKQVEERANLRVQQELRQQRDAVESELAKMRQTSLAKIADEMMQARRDVEKSITESQKQAQKEYEDASKQAAIKMAETQQTSLRLIDSANEQARTIVAEARAEAKKLHQATTDDAKLTQQHLDEDIVSKRKELKILSAQLNSARKLLSEVESLEERRQKAQHDLQQFEATFADRQGSIEAELKELRDCGLMDHETRKRAQEEELAKQKLKGIDAIRVQLEVEEKKYDQSKRFRATALTETLSDRLLPKLDDWLQDPEQARLAMKSEIDQAVAETLLNEPTTFRSSPQLAPEKLAQKKIATRRWLKASGLMLILLGFVFWNKITDFANGFSKDNYASQMIEARRIQSIYVPEQSDKYQATYTDNVLFMKNYYSIKTDPKYMQKWTLKLNNLKLLKSMDLTEDSVVQFIAKETSLIHRLGDLRNAIDRVYLNEGVERMRSAEADDLKDIKALLRTPENFEKIRKLEEESLR